MTGAEKSARFLEHLQPLQRKLEGYCRRMAYSADAVPDILQSAVASAFRDFDLYAEGTNFPAWAFGYLHREIQNANRRHRKLQAVGEPEDVAARDSWSPPHELPVHRLLLDAPEVILDRCDADLAGGVRLLRPLERSVLLLHAVGEFKYREIAEILTVPIGTVMSSLARARQHVREHLNCPGGRHRLHSNTRWAMTCTESRQHWHLYHDSEGDARLHLEIEDHLAGCPACADWFHLQSRLEGLIAEKLAEPAAEPALWGTVLAGAGLHPPRSVKTSYWLAGLAVTASVVLFMIGLGQFGRKAPVADLAVVSASWHDRIQTGGEPLQFASTDDSEVEAYLKGRVPFPVRCPPRKDAGFAVRGAGVREVEGRPAAYLSGTVGDVPVSILVLPRDALLSFPVQHAALRDRGLMHSPAGPYAMVVREFDRNAIVVVGRTDPHALERVINAYGSYPD